MQNDTPSTIVVAICCAILFGTAVDFASADRPNVVLIIADDLGWTDYGFMGHREIQTPHLDRLASQSLVYTRGYVPSSLCRPSLASIITGHYPHQHGITGNDPRFPRGARDAGQRRETTFAHADLLERLVARIDAQPTLPRLLATAGYLSHQSGKWWEGEFRRGGFTHGMTHGDRTRGGRHGDEGLKIGREGMGEIFDFLAHAKSENKPFFLWYAPFLPHAPHDPPQRLLNQYRDKTDSLAITKYWAMCQWFDETCGQLLEGIDKQGLSGNTIVIYVTDNGWINLPDSSQYAPKSKRSPYDGGVRTPIMIRWPGRVPPRRDQRTLVSSVDIAPTVLAACGVPLPQSMPGTNLLDGEKLHARDMVLGEIYTHDVPDVERPTSGLQYRWCVAGWWKLIVPNEKNVPESVVELYDLEHDPFETRNLAAEHPQVVKQLHERIDCFPVGRISNPSGFLGSAQK